MDDSPTTLSSLFGGVGPSEFTGRTPKSNVWQFFKKLAPELAECMLCEDGKKKTYKLAKKSTSGMIAHLRAYHKEAYMQVGDQRNLHSRRARQCAMIMIDTPSVPPSLFRSESFLGLFPDIEWPHFPTAVTLSSVILPEMLAEITSKNRTDLTGVPVTLLVDSWTSRPRSKGRERATLIVVLAYFVNAFWEMEGRLVAVRHISEDPTPDAMRAALEQIILDANLDNVAAIVSDSAHSIRAAVEMMGYRNPHCANHQLTLAVARGLDSWSEGAQLLRKLRALARDLNEPANVALRSEFFHFCSIHSLPVAVLPSHSSTRWGGECRLVEAAAEQVNAINDTLDATGQGRFSAEEVDALTAAAAVLKPFGKLGVELAQEGRLLSESLFVLRKLEKHLESCSSATSHTSTRSLALAILPHFTALTPHFFSASSSLESVFFDPGALFHFKGEINWRSVAASLSPSLASLPSSSASSSVSTPSLCLSSRRAALYADDDEPPVKMVKREEPPRAGLDAELLLYLEQSLNGIDVSLEALDFWKTHNDKFPNLSLLARRFLSSPPTSLDAERVLSSAGLLVSTTLDNLLANGNAEEICMLRLAKMGSLRALSHSRDRVIVPAGSADGGPEEVDEAPEAEDLRDTIWDGEEAPTGRDESGPIFSDVKAEVKEELPDSFFPNSSSTTNGGSPL